MNVTTINKIIDLLERKFTADEIVRVLDIEAVRRAPPIVPQPQPQPQRHGVYRPREENYAPLITAIASTVTREGAIEGTLRDVCERHRTAWLACLPNQNLKPTVRGFAAVVVAAREKHGGVLRGVLKVTRGAPRSGDPKDGYVYRFEAA